MQVGSDLQESGKRAAAAFEGAARVLGHGSSQLSPEQGSSMGGNSGGGQLRVSPPQLLMQILPPPLTSVITTTPSANN